MSLNSLRDDFPYLERRVGGKPLIYFDNAATSQKPQQVISALSHYYANHCANVHRVVHQLGRESTEQFEAARGRVARFIQSDEDEVVFVRNTTEGINLVSQGLPANGRVVTPISEHHSNYLPWLGRHDVETVCLDGAGHIDLQDLQAKLSSQPLLLAVSHVSNVLGVIQPIREMIELAKRHGVLTLIDAAQSAPHLPINVKDLDCDFLVFSGHKMLAPSGIGVLYVKKDHLERLTPRLLGGGAVEEVSLEHYQRTAPPHCFEAGTPNIEGAIALATAIDYLEDIGLEEVSRHSQQLVERAVTKFARLNEVQVIGSTDPTDRLSTFSFLVDGLDAHSVAKVLNHRANVIIRSGFHCAQPLHQHLGLGATARASFYLYNTEDEVDVMVELVGKIAHFL